MHDFFCTDSGDMNYEQLADKVRYLKISYLDGGEYCSKWRAMEIRKSPEIIALGGI